MSGSKKSPKTKIKDFVAYEKSLMEKGFISMPQQSSGEFVAVYRLEDEKEIKTVNVSCEGGVYFSLTETETKESTPTE